jgi:hypothetical protein
LAHGLTSLWLLLDWPKSKTALRSSVRIRGQAKIVRLNERSADIIFRDASTVGDFASRASR